METTSPSIVMIFLQLPMEAVSSPSFRLLSRCLKEKHSCTKKSSNVIILRHLMMEDISLEQRQNRSVVPSIMRSLVSSKTTSICVANWNKWHFLLSFLLLESLLKLILRCPTSLPPSLCKLPMSLLLRNHSPTQFRDRMRRSVKYLTSLTSQFLLRLITVVVKSMESVIRII